MCQNFILSKVTHKCHIISKLLNLWKIINVLALCLIFCMIWDTKTLIVNDSVIITSENQGQNLSSLSLHALTYWCAYIQILSVIFWIRDLTHIYSDWSKHLIGLCLNCQTVPSEKCLWEERNPQASTLTKPLLGNSAFTKVEKLP